MKLLIKIANQYFKLEGKIQEGLNPLNLLRPTLRITVESSESVKRPKPGKGTC